MEIVTPDDVEDAPTEKWGFPITTIKGFRFALYSEICLTFDLRRISLDIMRRFKPDLLHVTSPGFIVFIGIIIALCLSAQHICRWCRDRDRFNHRALCTIVFITLCCDDRRNLLDHSLIECSLRRSFWVSVKGALEGA